MSTSESASGPGPAGQALVGGPCRAGSLIVGLAVKILPEPVTCHCGACWIETGTARNLASRIGSDWNMRSYANYNAIISCKKGHRLGYAGKMQQMHKYAHKNDDMQLICSLCIKNAKNLHKICHYIDFSISKYAVICTKEAEL